MTSPASTSTSTGLPHTHALCNHFCDIVVSECQKRSWNSSGCSLSSPDSRKKILKNTGMYRARMSGSHSLVESASLASLQTLAALQISHERCNSLQTSSSSSSSNNYTSSSSNGRYIAKGRAQKSLAQLIWRISCGLWFPCAQLIPLKSQGFWDPPNYVFRGRWSWYIGQPWVMILWLLVFTWNSSTRVSSI